MRILLVHQNFPAQFKHLVPALAARPGTEVVVITDKDNSRPKPALGPNFRVLGYPFPLPDTGASPKLAENYAWRVQRGEAAAQLAEDLQGQGFTPDIVYGHPGWGETLFLRDVFPRARIILYAESFYQPEGSGVGFDPEFADRRLDGRLKARTRNAAQLAALDTADAGISPTAWQASRFPDYWRSRIDVVHDGIDTEAVKPGPAPALKLGDRGTLKPGDEVVTFINRTLEPSRGYHIFMRALPKVLAARPSAQVLIIGGAGNSYGPPAPEGTSWHRLFLDEVRASIDVNRVSFLGKVPYRDLLALLRLSSAHVYLTYPTVLSWSMLEAMASGCLVIGSATAPVEEVIEHEKNGILVDFFDVDKVAGAIIDGLANRERYRAIRTAARETVVSRYDLRRHCLPRQLALLGCS